MGSVFSRLFGGSERAARRDLDRRVTLFRQGLAALGAAPARDSLDLLVARLRELELEEDDVALELEVVEGFRQVFDLAALTAGAGPPILETTHRVLADDRCYFSAPASLIASGADQTGKLLLTDRRAIFVGGTVASLPWRSVTSVVEDQRDVVFGRNGSAGVRCRCNSFVDSKRGAFLAHWLRDQALR